MDNFTQIPFTIENLDRYYIRTSIFNALKENLKYFKGKLLDYGCGKMPYKKFILENSNVSEYIGIDIENALDYKGDKPNFTWKGDTLPFENETFDTIFATEVFEHIHDLDFALIEIYRVLKKGGYLFFTVPYLWTLHEVPNDEYRYTPFSLEKKFKRANFMVVNIFATGGWNASLAQMLGLWVRRKPMSENKRKLFSIILKPFIKYLIKKDLKPTMFKEGNMITGLYGIIKKE
jgi:SAM-dependent methyltransferase